MSTFVRSFKCRKIFLDNLADGSSESQAARAAGSAIRNFRKWRDQDPDFSKDWEEAIEEGTDFIEDVAVQRALKKSDPLMMMMLKARRPDKYDRGGKLELSGSVNVEGSKQKLLNRIARLQAERQIIDGTPPEEQEVPDAEDGAKAKPKLLKSPARAVPVQEGRSSAKGSDRRKAAS